LVSARIPGIPLYERLGDATDQNNLIELERLTNPRVQAEKGLRSFLRKEDFFLKGVSSYVRAGFSYLAESRFGYGAFPVLYTASDEQTALAEKKFHWAKRLRDHHTPPTAVQDVALLLSLSGDFHDLRGLQKSFRAVYRPDTYQSSQALGRELWKAGSQGIAYTSVRRPDGECLAVFSPQTITACARDAIYEFHWDGQNVIDAFRLDRR